MPEGGVVFHPASGLDATAIGEVQAAVRRRLLLARGPPLWEMQGSRPGESDPQAQPAPDYEFDQRVAW